MCLEVTKGRQSVGRMQCLHVIEDACWRQCKRLVKRRDGMPPCDMYCHASVNIIGLEEQGTDMKGPKIGVQEGQGWQQGRAAEDREWR